jgi:hypothetical protein
MVGQKFGRCRHTISPAPNLSTPPESAVVIAATSSCGVIAGVCNTSRFCAAAEFHRFERIGIVYQRNLTFLVCGLFRPLMLPNSTLVVLKNAGHFSMLEKPVEFNRILSAFLSQHSGQSGDFRSR